MCCCAGCQCGAGYKPSAGGGGGAACVVDRCYEKLCSGHGSCDTNSGECRCAPGYTGADCAAGLVFPGSRLITAEWGVNLDGWMPAKVKGKQWKVCFSSFTDNATTPSTFHNLCDQYDTTLTVARNSLKYIFGGYVRSLLLCFVPALCFLETRAVRILLGFI